MLRPGVTLVDSAEETARDVVPDVPERFVRIGERFLGARVQSAVRIER